MELSLRSDTSRFDVEVDTAGAFRTGGLPDGEYSLTAVAEDRQYEYRARVRARAGDEGVRIRLTASPK